MKFRETLWDPSYDSERRWPIVYSMFPSEDIPHKVSKLSQNDK